MEKKDFVLGVLAASNVAEHTPVQVQKLFFIIGIRVPHDVTRFFRKKCHRELLKQ